jgi:hypothetical protein
VARVGFETYRLMTPLTEADTCRKYVLPKLYAAGWDDDRINEQRTFTDCSSPTPPPNSTPSCLRYSIGRFGGNFELCSNSSGI